jgi:hypothetical protein
MQTHKGSCHCGAVTYDVITNLEKVIECNCSHCARKGLVLTFVPASDFTLITGEDNLTEYLFNKKHIHHLFCKTCGVQAFGNATNAEGKTTVAINVRTLPEVDLSTLTITPVDGKSF